mgnify:CR=1 FL=1
MPQLEYLDLYMSSYSDDTISDLDSFQSVLNTTECIKKQNIYAIKTIINMQCIVWQSILFYPILQQHY